MAKIWPVYEGKEPTIGGPWARLPVSQAIALFELRPDDFISVLTETPRFGDATREFTYAGYKHIVVEIDEKEGGKVKWKSGFYKSKITPSEGFRRLIEDVFVSVLGKDVVARVDYDFTTDSLDREALKITVVIDQDATDRLQGDAVINASARLKERLREMRDDRFPIIEYATEAELEQVAGPES